MTIAVPAQGQLVRVRQRLFAVDDVKASSLPPAVLSEGAFDGPQHLVTLTSVEDDGRMG